MVRDVKQPNVVVFFTDQQRWDAMGVHGNPLGLTPNFDRYCRTGTHLAKCFTNQPVCGPARACMQTGLYATQNGSYKNHIPLNRELKTLAMHFNEAGYDTGYIGKWHLGSSSRGPLPEEERGGYKYWLASNSLEWTSDAYDTRVYSNEGKEVRLPGYRVDALTDASIRFIADRQDRPFFLFTSYLEPHHQNSRDDYPAPDGYEEAYQGRWTPPDLQALGGSSARHLGGYWGMVKRLDEAFGRLMDALKSMNLMENTVVLFTSDHGCHFRTRNKEYKRSCHDSALRVPGLLHGPGFEGGRRLESLTGLIDLPPTLLDAAGIRVPPEWAGRSLFQRLKNGGPGEEDDFVIAQISEAEHGRAIRTQRWKYAISAPWVIAPRPERYREAFLYDLKADPYELNNLIGLERFAGITKALHEKLVDSLAKIGEPFVPTDPADRSAISDRRGSQWHPSPR